MPNVLPTSMQSLDSSFEGHPYHTPPRDTHPSPLDASPSDVQHTTLERLDTVKSGIAMMPHGSGDTGLPQEEKTDDAPSVPINPLSSDPGIPTPSNPSRKSSAQESENEMMSSTISTENLVPKRELLNDDLKEKLKKIESMGYENASFIAVLLQMHKGNVAQVLEDLRTYYRR